LKTNTLLKLLRRDFLAVDDSHRLARLDGEFTNEGDDQDNQQQANNTGNGKPDLAVEALLAARQQHFFTRLSLRLFLFVTSLGHGQSHLFGDERQEGQVPGPLDGRGQTTLVFGARACLATRLDSAVLGHITAQHVKLLVIDLVYLVSAESADTGLAMVRARPHPAFIFFTSASAVAESLSILGHEFLLLSIAGYPASRHERQ
jgi:hypothetical protein